MPDLPPIARDLIDALDEPSLVVEGGIIRLANPPARDLLGAAIEGRDVRLAIRHPQVLERIANPNSGDLEVTGLAEVGRTWRLVIRALDGGAVLVRLFDLSAAVSAEKMRVDFVANASHELRTPLSTVGGYAETLAEEGDLPADVRTGFGRTIRDEARRMLRIIEDLMSLSRIEADRFVTPNDRVNVGAVLESAIANARRSRAAGSCVFDLDLAEKLPPVRGDPGELTQLFDNVLANAVRYGSERPESRIEISAQRDSRWVIVTVTDHGPGISREHLPRLTERFYRVDPARSRESGGTGLGLAIVKHIVERHRGGLEIKSSVGVGTSVSVRLPISD